MSHHGPSVPQIRQAQEELERRRRYLSRASIEEQDAKRGDGSRWVLFCLILAVAYLLWRW